MQINGAVRAAGCRLPTLGLELLESCVLKCCISNFESPIRLTGANV